MYNVDTPLKGGIMSHELIVCYRINAEQWISLNDSHPTESRENRTLICRCGEEWVRGIKEAKSLKCINKVFMKKVVLDGEFLTSQEIKLYKKATCGTSENLA